MVVGGGGHAQRHAGGHRCWGVGERCWIVHSGTGEAAVCEGGQAGELTLKLAWVG